MADKMSATEQANAREKLSAAGCPDGVSERLVAASPWSVILAILAFVRAHPELAAEVWALIQAIISGGGLPAPTL